MLHSLRIRLLVVWALSLLGCIVIGFLLVQLFQRSTRAQIDRAEAVVARACDLIRDHYAFYAAGWSGPGVGPIDEQMRVVPGNLSRPAEILLRMCESITQAPAPELPIHRGRASPSLLAHVLVAKFADHLPLYRQSEIYERSGRTG